MDLNQKIIAALLAGFFIIALLRVFSAPVRVALRLLLNTLLGFLALWAVHLTAGFTGVALGHPMAWIFADAFLIPTFLLCRKKVEKRQQEFSRT